jgi:hypothetical protein
MKSDLSKQGGGGAGGPSRQPRSVQFSPDTVTVKVSSAQSSSNSSMETQQQRLHKMISYNRWIGVKPPPGAVLMSGPGGVSMNPYHESSFTGQPIAMLPPGVVMHHPGHHRAPKTPVMAYPAGPVMDDVPRKWTEKKKVKWRSRSTPRSSEIDEIIGSSRTKAPNRYQS